MEKNTFGKEVNLNGEYIYNVEKILVECEAKYNDKNSFIEYLSKLLNEKQKDLLLRLYSIAEKQFILSTFINKSIFTEIILLNVK